MSRIDWKQYFLAQASVAALRSTCTRLSVGAVIVKDNRMIATGYNGSISDGDHCLDKGCHIVDNHCIRTIHAEVNAIIQCARFGVSTENTDIYVTYFPCVHCTKQIIQAGIKRVFYEKNYKNDPLAIELMKEAGIHLEQVSLRNIEIIEKKSE